MALYKIYHFKLGYTINFYSSVLVLLKILFILSSSDFEISFLALRVVSMILYKGENIDLDKFWKTKSGAFQNKEKTDEKLEGLKLNFKYFKETN